MHMRDSEIVASIVAGESRGLAAAYDRYADSLYKYCRTLLRDPAHAADAVQDTFVIAAARLDGLRAPEQLRAWLFTVARNECLRIGRVGKATPAPDQTLADSVDLGAPTGPAGLADLSELFDAATNGLNPDEREVVELQLRAGLAAGEVADVLCVSTDYAHMLLSRAREHLETSLGVLLVARADRSQCGELGVLLRGWDGRLTAPLRNRLHRHIRHCKACTATRAYQLRRSLVDVSTGAALTSGAALSLRAEEGPPAELREHTLALAAGQGPAAAVHSAAVLSRTGAFTKAGFPKPTANAVLAGQHGAGLAVRHAASGLKTGVVEAALRSSSRQTAVTAAGVIAVTAAVAAFSLTGTTQRFTPTADPKPAVTFGPPLTYVPPAATATRLARTAAPSPRKAAPAKSKAAPTPASAPPAVLSVPPPVQPSPPPTKENAPAPAPVKEHTSPAHHKTHPAPRPTPTPKPAPTGTLSAFPGGGTLVIQPGGAAQVQLTAAGGSVSWSVTVANDPDGAVSVSPASGTLTAGDPSATVTVTVSQYLDCGQGCPTITISPGGETYTIWTGDGTGGGKHHHHHHHGRHNQNSNSAPAAAVVSATSRLYMTETRRITISQTR